MYTELYLQVALKKDTPPAVIATLNFMLGNTEEEPATWDIPMGLERFMLQCSSFYHYPFAHSHLDYIDYSNGYYLFVRCDFKNYNKELERFLDFLCPYVEKDSHGYQGHHRYEECDYPSRITFTGHGWYETQLTGKTDD